MVFPFSEGAYCFIPLFLPVGYLSFFRHVVWPVLVPILLGRRYYSPARLFPGRSPQADRRVGRFPRLGHAGRLVRVHLRCRRHGQGPLGETMPRAVWLPLLYGLYSGESVRRLFNRVACCGEWGRYVRCCDLSTVGGACMLPCFIHSGKGGLSVGHAFGSLLILSQGMQSRTLSMCGRGSSVCITPQYGSSVARRRCQLCHGWPQTVSWVPSARRWATKSSVDGIVEAERSG